MTAHGRSRIRSRIAGTDVCRCGAWLEDCPVLAETKRPAPDWDGSTLLLPVVSTAPLLTRGQEERVCRDVD